MSPSAQVVRLKAAFAAAVLTCSASVQADPIAVHGGPTYSLTTGGYVFGLGSPLALSESGLVAAGYAKYDSLGNSAGSPPVRWGATQAPQDLLPLSTSLDFPYGQSNLTTIDSAGNVFGSSRLVDDSDDASGDFGNRPVRWNLGSAAPIEMSTLGVDSFGRASAAPAAVNDFGIAVGTSTKPNNDGNVAVRWNLNGAISELGSLPIAQPRVDFLASGINDAGTIVGHAQAFTSGGGNGGTYAVRWDASGTSATMIGEGFQARQINSAGVIAGSDSSNQQAVRWDAGSTHPTLLHGPSSAAGVSAFLDLNEAGVLVGRFSTHGALWLTGTAEAFVLQDLPGYSFNVANSLNDAGVIVGRASQGAIARAVLWDMNGTVIDLNTLIDSNSGWTLTHAVNINNANWITGIGAFDPDGPGGAAQYGRVFLLQVPEPGYGMSVILAALALLFGRSRMRK